MRQVPGVDPERLERLYLLASAKAQVIAAEQLLREAVENVQIASDHTRQACVEAVRAVVTLRDELFQLLEDAP